MRPRGEYRSLLFDALAAPATVRDLAARTQVAYEVTRRTIDNMRRGGEIVVVDEIRVEGVKQRVQVFARADVQSQHAAAAELAARIGSWAEFV